jgi:hypothetical protein
MEMEWKRQVLKKKGQGRHLNKFEKSSNSIMKDLHW